MKQIILFLAFFLSISLAFGQTSYRTVGSSAAVTEFQVYPNPAVSFFQVSSNQSVARVAVMNLTGRKVKDFVYQSEEQYYVGDLPKGMYLVQLVDARNQRIATRRMNIN